MTHLFRRLPLLILLLVGALAYAATTTAAPPPARPSDSASGSRLLPPRAQPGGWSDNFDAYETGSQLHGQGGWKGWDNNPTFGALTTDVQARSAPNSVEILGLSDLVHEYSGYTSGQWVYTAWWYVPSEHTGLSYFILLNNYLDNGPKNWSVTVVADSDAELVYDFCGGALTPLLTDQWVEVRVEIDLDADQHSFYYGETLLYSAAWSGYCGGDGEPLVNIAAVDLYAGDSPAVYYDDLSLQAAGGGGAPEIEVSPSSLASTQPPDTITTQPMTISNLGTTVLTWNIEEQPTLPRWPALPYAPATDPDALATDDAPSGAAPPAGARIGSLTGWEAPAGALYDNGPLVNSPGTGYEGADESQAQDQTLNMTNHGWNVSVAGGFRLTDQFTVTDPGGWQINAITIFAYQNNSGTSSTITGANYQIWDNAPDRPGAMVIYGDPTTNVLVSTEWSDSYRVRQSTTGNNERPIMVNLLSADVWLPPGTYWLDWQVEGSPDLPGPWGPPITINGQATTGDAMQFNGSEWTPIADETSGTLQGMPFILAGEVVAVQCTVGEVPWLSVEPTSGTTEPGSASTVAVTFDSTALAPGVYEADLCVNSDDADEPTVLVPVTLSVEEPTALVVDTFVVPPRAFGRSFVLAAFVLLGLAGLTSLAVRRREPPA
ncbi:MAG: BACON domain-containing protein [Ardenticatenaceae bacterium]